MVDVAHKNLTGVDLHEPKGVAAAAADTVYISDGGGSGTWGKVTPAVTDGTFTPGAVLLRTVTASASATIDFVHGVSGVVLDNTYDGYEIRINSLRPATDDTQLQIQIGTGAGPTYASGASDYKYGIYYASTSSSNNLGDSAHTSIIMNPVTTIGMANDSYQNAVGVIRFANPDNTALKQVFNYELSYVMTNDDPMRVIGAGMYVSTGAITAVRLSMSSGNITSGTISLYGIVK